MDKPRQIPAVEILINIGVLSLIVSVGWRLYLEIRNPTRFQVATTFATPVSSAPVGNQPPQQFKLPTAERKLLTDLEREVTALAAKQEAQQFNSGRLFDLERQVASIVNNKVTNKPDNRLLELERKVNNLANNIANTPAESGVALVDIDNRVAETEQILESQAQQLLQLKEGQSQLSGQQVTKTENKDLARRVAATEQLIKAQAQELSELQERKPLVVAAKDGSAELAAEFNNLGHRLAKAESLLAAQAADFSSQAQELVNLKNSQPSQVANGNDLSAEFANISRRLVEAEKLLSRQADDVGRQARELVTLKNRQPQVVNGKDLSAEFADVSQRLVKAEKLLLTQVQELQKLAERKPLIVAAKDGSSNQFVAEFNKLGSRLAKAEQLLDAQAEELLQIAERPPTVGNSQQGAEEIAGLVVRVAKAEQLLSAQAERVLELAAPSKPAVQDIQNKNAELIADIANRVTETEQMFKAQARELSKLKSLPPVVAGSGGSDMELSDINLRISRAEQQLAAQAEELIKLVERPPLLSGGADNAAEFVAIDKRVAEAEQRLAAQALELRQLKEQPVLVAGSVDGDPVYADIGQRIAKAEQMLTAQANELQQLKAQQQTATMNSASASPGLWERFLALFNSPDATPTAVVSDNRQTAAEKIAMDLRVAKSEKLLAAQSKELAELKEQMRQLKTSSANHKPQTTIVYRDRESAVAPATTLGSTDGNVRKVGFFIPAGCFVNSRYAYDRELLLQGEHMPNYRKGIIAQGRAFTCIFVGPIDEREEADAILQTLQRVKPSLAESVLAYK